MGRNYRQGRFFPSNPRKYVGDLNNIVFRSSWELKMFHWCDLNPSVVQWNSEGCVVPYYSKMDGKARRYFVDFVVKIQTSSGELKTLLVEIKPDDQCRPPKPQRNTRAQMERMYHYQVNQDKWEAATEYAKKNGMEFRVLTEYDLGLKKRR